MKAGTLGKELGVHHLKVGKVRKQLFPESSGELSEEEASAIREYLTEATKPSLVEVKVVHADPRFPGFADARVIGTDEVVLVQIPYGYEAERFVGREVYVEKRKTGDDTSIYAYNPWI